MNRNINYNRNITIALWEKLNNTFSQNDTPFYV